MLEILGSILSGGATGLLGVGIQKFFDHKAKKLELELRKIDHAHELATYKAKAEMAAAEWAGRVEVEDSKAFKAAVEAEGRNHFTPQNLTPAQQWLMLFVDFMRKIVRPGLTLYLCAITTLAYIQANALLDGFLVTGDAAFALVNRIVETVLYLTCVCATFWFGVRGKSR